MSDNEERTVEILKDMDGMSPEKIEDIRKQFNSKLQKEDPERYHRIEEYVNALCDVAINRAKKQIQVA